VKKNMNFVLREKIVCIIRN